MSSINDLARSYYDAVHAAAKGEVLNEPEAQLTTPVSNLFRELVQVSGLGKIDLIRETRLDRTRPDFAVILTKNSKILQKGYIELKAPNVNTNADTWTGRNARQWESMKLEAEILIVCNGENARLYKNGVVFGEEAQLPYHNPINWDSAPLIRLLGHFLEATLTPITSVSDLSRRLAIRTADLRDRLVWLLEQSTSSGEAARGSLNSWKQHVHPDASHKNFADGISQVIAYGMVLAALSALDVDSNSDGIITVSEARNAIRSFSPVMAAAFAPLVDKPILFDAVKIELGALESLISAIDAKKVNRSADRRGEAWLYFYEDFLSVYDPQARKEAGVYYTPIDIVRAMINITDHLLVERLGKRLGFADPTVVTLDPATGTGTFPLAVIDHAITRVEELRGKAGKAQAAENLIKNLFAFELLPGPYSVAHLRLTQRLRELISNQDMSARVILTDTLESPLDPKEQLSLFGDAEVLAAEQNRAKRIKLEQKVTVVIGNPPYRRVERDMDGRGSGGWVINGKVPGRKSGKSLFDDILDIAKKTTIFSHHASLYNLYIYFWRWSIWKAFEAHGDGPGIVSFITGSSWLTGPGFGGLRKIIREMCDDVWVLDLGGDNKGANPEENVFAIETPVAVVVLIRNGGKNASKPANVNYRRIVGSAEQKLLSLADIGNSKEPLEGKWLEASTGWLEPFKPATGNADWYAMPGIKEIFPWQQPGCKLGRTWPVAPSRDLLNKRWDVFVSSSREEKPLLFVTGKTGRKVDTQVTGLRRLIDLKAGQANEIIVKYSFRSFDRQWTFKDPRLMELERPSLWQSMSDKQIFLTTLMTGQISAGPAMTVSAYIPDLHHFRGSFGGKDIIPLYRDANATSENLTKNFSKVLAKRLSILPPNVEDVAAYVYGILGSNNYYDRFADALKTPGPRVPITADKHLWARMVSLGKYMIWLHTFAERLQDPKEDRNKFIPSLPHIAWEASVTLMPQEPADIIYNKETKTLHIGNGQIVGVSEKVWEYNVSGMQILKKWLGYRTVKGAGRATSSKSSLDQIRPNEWVDDWNDELLDLIRILTITIEKQSDLESIVSQICEGELISVNNFPIPKKAETLPPKDLTGQLLL